LKNKIISMIIIKIPGSKTIKAEHLVLDYNGTLAVDGILIPCVKQKLNSLADKINIHVITADTFGKAVDNLKEIPCQCSVLMGNNQQLQKLQFITRLGKQKVIAIGNGTNDLLMLKNAALGIAVIQKEGTSSKTMYNADIVCKDITDALDLLLNPLRIVATLRN